MIRPTHYVIRSYPSDAESEHLKSWVVEGSLDGLNWMVIDRRRKNFDLNEEFAVAIFPVSHSENCHFIRLTQTGKNHAGDHLLTMSAFEVFGTLVE
jgi:hypothetical protein